MKKKMLCLLVGAVFSMAAFGQVMNSKGIKNTLSTSFGRSYDNVQNDNRENVHFHGFFDTFQVRYDVGKFTVESMLNWGIINDWGGDGKVTFANTERTPFWYTNHFNQGGWWTNGNTESYYVNFLLRPISGLDIGAGTRLNWKVGPAPSTGANYWEPKVHVAQGGLKDANPGAADVVGFAYYANKYTSNYKSNTNASLGIRYKYKSLFEIGVALPSGASTDEFVFNAGFTIQPLDLFSVAIAYDGIAQSSYGNLYLGGSLFFKNLVLDLYVAGNFRPDSKDFRGNNIKNDRVGYGLAATVSIPQINFVMKPEVGFTDYINPNYTFAWYTGGRFDFTFAEILNLGTWISFAGGASNKNWYNEKNPTYVTTKNYTGGFIFNIRPDFSWDITNRHKITIFFDYQNRKNFKNDNYDVWSGGFTWSYKY